MATKLCQVFRAGVRGKSQAIKNNAANGYCKDSTGAGEPGEQASTALCHSGARGVDAESAAANDTGPTRKGRKPKPDSADPAAEPADSAAPPEAKASRKGRRPKAETDKWDRLAAESLGFEAATAAGLGLAQLWQGYIRAGRRLHAAAADGNISAAESAVSAMTALGLPPGPRAYHILLCAYLKAKDLEGALQVTGRATEAGVQLLPESYAALIFSHLDATPPNVGVAEAVYSAMAGTDTDPQIPWAVLCRLLSSKGFATEAVAAVRQGLAAGLSVDADVAEAYVKALCQLQEPDAALTFLEGMPTRYQVKPEARHVNYVVAAFSLQGNLTDARGLVDAAGPRGWGRDAGTFNGLLMGLVMQLDSGDEVITNDFTMARSRMVQSGVRPDKFTFKWEAEGMTKLRDGRSAMGAIKSLRTAAGGVQRSPMEQAKKAAGAAEAKTCSIVWYHLPYDDMDKYINGVAIGPGRCVVDDSGSIVPVAKLTIKELRAEVAARDVAGAEDMKKAELTAVVKAARSKLPFNVLQVQVKGVDSTKTSKKAAAKPATAAKKTKRKGWRAEEWTIDGPVVDIRPTDMLTVEADKYLLGAAALQDIDLTDDEYGVASNKTVKDVNLEALLEAKMLDEGAAAVMNIGDEDLTAGFATLLPGAEEDDDDQEDDDGGRVDDDSAWRRQQNLEARASSVLDPQTLQEGYRQLQYLESQQIDTDEANIVAGMDVALDIVRATEMISGRSNVMTPADVLTLAEAAKAERSPAAAADVAVRLSALLLPGAIREDGTPYSQAFVLQQYSDLAELCLKQRAVQAADLVLEAAETAGLKPSQELLNRLTVALRGQPRRMAPSGVKADEGEVDDDEEEEEEDEEGQDEQMTPELWATMSMLSGVANHRMREDAFAHLFASQGMNPEEVAEIMAQPEALRLDNNWMLSMLLEPPPNAQKQGLFDDEEDVEVEAAAEAAEEEAAAGGIEQQQDMEQPGLGAADAGQGEEGDNKEEGEEEAEEYDPDDVTLWELAEAAASNRLTPGQKEAIISAAQRENMPLLLDENDDIIWPGTPAFDKWAQDEPEAAAEDYGIMLEMLDQVFEEEGVFKRAEASTAAFLKHLKDEGIELETRHLDEEEEAELQAAEEARLQQRGEDGEQVLELDPETAEAVTETQKMLARMFFRTGVMRVNEDDVDDEGEASGVFAPSALNVDVEKELQDMAEQIGPLIEQYRQQLDLDKLEAVGFPVEEFGLRAPRPGADSGKRVTTGSGSSSS
eukprot:gene5582-5820_t